MSSIATGWHLKRRQQIIEKYPQILELPQHDSLSLLMILLTPIFYVVMAALCQYLPWWSIFLLAWVLGSRCQLAMFHYSHELSHHLIHPKITKETQQKLLRYLNLLNLSTSVYLLFQFGHLPHHANLGRNSLEDAKRFLSTPHPDIELLIDRYYYQLTDQESHYQRQKTSACAKDRLLRFLSIGLIYPLSSFTQGTILFHLIILIKFIKSCLIKELPRTRTRLNLTIIQIGLLYLLLIPIYLLFGIKAIMFIVISDMAQRGLLWHPICTFPMGSHKSWRQNQIQPTTSNYSLPIRWWLMNMNYHVEHHDFPSLPASQLKKLRQTAPEFYENLNSFKGYFDVLSHYFKTIDWDYADQEKGYCHEEV